MPLAEANLVAAKEPGQAVAIQRQRLSVEDQEAAARTFEQADADLSVVMGHRWEHTSPMALMGYAFNEKSSIRVACSQRMNLGGGAIRARRG